MLVGQQIGPFLIEREIGAGAMGAVYRARYVKTGQLVAIKVMAPGLGTTNPQALARFEREANILKQLNHRNIVRLFGVGKHHGAPYYAMEYVQGESLDRLMARRDRMSWEEVVDLGTQLCDALKHAHDKGIVHRDLKPSNLMILADGTLKLTDFGIAKDLDVTALTGANCTVGTAAYMSPEQCKGDPNITYKSDLYSLGVVFYELITGRKPFHAENAMDMFVQHVQGTFERPSRLVLDLPIWLDTLICQLLEKAPEKRPLDAAMVGSVLASIQEKVEAQQAAGVDAARARLMDRPKDQRSVSDEDRDAARTLLGKKPRGKKKARKRRWKVLVQAGGLVFLLGVVIAAIVFALRPPSADSLYRQAEQLMLSDNPDNVHRAREGPIEQYLRRYGKLADEKTRKIQQWADDYDANRYEGLLDKHIAHKMFKKGFAPEAQSRSQEQAFLAAEAEYHGKAAEAAKLWKEVLAREGPSGIGVVAHRHLKALADVDEEDRQLAALHQKARDPDVPEPKLDELRQQAYLAYRQEQLGDRLGARKSHERLREQAAGKDSSQSQRFWQLYASVNMKKLDDSLDERPQEEKARLKRISQALQKQGAEEDLLTWRQRVHDVVTIYAKDEDFDDLVQQARTLRKEIDKKLGKD